MNLESVPIGVLIIGSCLIVLACIETGYWFGKKVIRRMKTEDQSLVSSISGYVLSLVAFIVAFTFAIVTGRYDYKKALVLEEANGIRTAWHRSDFLPDTDRVVAKNLLQTYVKIRLDAVKSRKPAMLKDAQVQSIQIQDQLWDMAVRNARLDMNSDVAALYVESLNEMNSLHSSRVMLGLYARIPGGIWFTFSLLSFVGMFSVGYQSAISNSKRSWAFVILAIAFSMILAMVVTMDKSYSPFTPVPQFPLEFLLEYMQGTRDPG